MENLGVIIDSKLNWNDHCTEIAAKARQALGLIQRTLQAATPKCKAIAYKALVRPCLEYASTAWNAHTAKNTRLLEGIKNNAARFVHRKYDWNTGVTALKQDLNWPTLLQRSKTHDLIMWYKIHFGIININFPSVVLPVYEIPKTDFTMSCLTSRFNTEWPASDTHSMSEPFLSGTPSLYHQPVLLRWIASSIWQRPTVGCPQP